MANGSPNFTFNKATNLLTVAGPATITGNLTVTGTQTVVNSNIIAIGDAILVLNSDIPFNIAPTENAGIEINRGSSANVQFIWDETNDRWSTNTASLYVGGGLIYSNNLLLQGDNTDGYIRPTNAGSDLYLGANNNNHVSIMNTGDVGIGTTTPGVKFEIVQNQAAYSYFDFRNQTNGGGIVWRQIVRNIANSGDATVDLAKLIGGGFAINNGDTHASNFTSFSVGASERMRITSVGELLINRTGASGYGKLNVEGGADFTNGNVLLCRDSGNVGVGTASPGYKLEVNGSFAATTKSFVINHPTKPDMKLRYGSLEGPENGVYVRGRLKASNEIVLPDYWTGLVDEESITVNLTPIGKHQKLSVSNVAIDAITIKNDNILNSAIDCYYIVYAERKDVEKLVVEY